MQVVLVHGFTQSGAAWARVAAELRERHPELEVITPDLPGHGGSTGLGDAVDLAAAARHLGSECGRACYVGYSMGGRVALQLALDEPSTVERLVLVSTTAGIEDPEERAARRGADEELAERLEAGGDEGLGQFVEEWLAGPLFSGLDERAANRGARLANAAAGLAAALRSLGTGAQLPNWERLGSLTAPSLVVAGEHDAKFVALGERLARAIGPGAELVLVPGAGHAVPFERPVAFAAMVGAFCLGGLGTGGGGPAAT